MESHKECCREATGSDEETRTPASEPSMTDHGLLKLHSTIDMEIAVDDKEQCFSKEYHEVSVTENSIDMKTEDLCQDSPKGYQLHEKFRSSPDELDIDISPNISPINTHQESVLSDVMLAVGENWSPYESDHDSGLDEQDDVQLDIPLNLVHRNLLPTEENPFIDHNYNRKFYENDISDINQNLDIGNLRLLNKSFSDLDQDLQFLTNNTVIQKCAKTWDLTSLGGENNTNDGNKEIIGSCYLPDDEFMEADRFLGDKGKQPASKRYAYKKRSKSTQAGTDSDNIQNKPIACDVKSYPQPPMSVPSTLPVDSSKLLRDGNSPSHISYENPPSSPTEPSLLQGALRDSVIRWNFQDRAFKLFSSDLRVLNFSTDHCSNNNYFSYRHENYCDSPNSDDDVNLQKGLLMSLQTMNNDEDSDVDVLN